MNETSQGKCQAKNPALCRYHGGRQLGVQAAAHIKQVLAERPARYYLTDDQLRTLPLKKLSATALALGIQNQVREQDMDVTKFDAVINIAADLHRKDLRANRGRYPRTPYIEHPLRNTARLLRFGCQDQATLLASVLHDTVEDHAREFSRKYAGIKTNDESAAREHAFAYVGREFGADTERILRGMSNELIPQDASEAHKNKLYRRHVLHAIEDPQVCASKVVDLLDNGGSLHHTLPTMSPEGVQRRIRKYQLVWDDVITRVKQDVFERRIPVSDQGREEMITQLVSAGDRLRALATDSAH